MQSLAILGMLANDLLGFQAPCFKSAECLSLSFVTIKPNLIFFCDLCLENFLFCFYFLQIVVLA